MEFLAGAFIGVLVAFVVQAYVQPAIQFREAIWEVDHSIILYANAYSNLAPEPRKVEAQFRFRDHAGALSSKSRALILYSMWVRLRLLPTRENILKASRKLIYLSGLARDRSEDAGINASDAEDEIRSLLGIKSAMEG